MAHQEKTLRYLRGGNGGRLYGTTSLGREYLCASRHRDWKHPDKSTWLQSIVEQDESDFYEASENAGWNVDGVHWWTSKDSTLKLGTANQRLAFFPKPTNTTDPAHGYPVTTYRNKDYTVPESIIQKWETGNNPHVNTRIAKKLRLKQI